MTYIQECPFCHVLHENKDQFNEWCEDHRELYGLFLRRNRTATEYPWQCPGCPQCKEPE